MNDLLAQHNPSTIAIIDGDCGTETTYGQLLTSVTRASDFLRSKLGRGIVFLFATNTVSSIVLYLSCLELGYPLCLLEPGPSNRLEPLLQTFDPDAVVLPMGTEPPANVRPISPLPDSSYTISLSNAGSSARPLHRDLALLLTTSGSTGSPKLVRLTRNNVLANAQS